MWMLFLVHLASLDATGFAPDKKPIAEFDNYQWCARERIRLNGHAAPMTTYECRKVDYE